MITRFTTITDVYAEYERGIPSFDEAVLSRDEVRDIWHEHDMEYNRFYEDDDEQLTKFWDSVWACHYSSDLDEED